MKTKVESRFVVTISDGFCAYSYPLHISKKMSVTKIANRIRKMYRLNPVDGTYEPDCVHPRFREDK